MWHQLLQKRALWASQFLYPNGCMQKGTRGICIRTSLTAFQIKPAGRCLQPSVQDCAMRLSPVSSRCENSSQPTLPSDNHISTACEILTVNDTCLQPTETLMIGA